MRPPYRNKLPVAIVVVIAGVVLIGWVARSTRAQVPVSKEPSPAATPAELSPVSPPPASSELPLPEPADAAPEPLPAKPSAGPLSAAPDPNPSVPESDDPERKARAFVEQNRKVAQDELKKLKDEGERLRTRLGKVEGGIRRWEALLAALENSETATRPAFKPVTDAPTVLEPAPVASSTLELPPVRSSVVAPQPR